MQAADVVAHHAAVVELRPQHGALLGARDGMGLDPERLADEVRLASEPLVVARLGRTAKAPREPELAVDRLAPDELGQVLARGLRLGLMALARAAPNRRTICR
jgi:hypothetical protein